MPVCSLCSHSDRAAIDRELIAGRALRNVAEQFSVSTTATYRHKSEHLPATLVKSRGAAERARADDLLKRLFLRMQSLERLAGKAEDIFKRAEEDEAWDRALNAIRTIRSVSGEIRECLVMLAKMRGELDERPVNNILLHPQFVQAQTVLLRALTPYPEARIAAASALADIEEHAPPVDVEAVVG